MMRASSGVALGAALTAALPAVVSFAPSSSLDLHRVPPSAASSTALSAGWLFTPDRTAGVLADHIADTAASAARGAAEASLEVAAHARDVAAGVAADTVTQVIYKAPFLSLCLSFLAGGLFFSTLLALVSGVVALGRVNTRRMLEVVSIVWRRNIEVTKLSLRIVMDVLRGKEKMSGINNRFPAAIQAFREGVAEVRRVFSESVKAIKKESEMYSAAIGLPGLIPIQYIFDRIFPSTLTAPFQDALRDSLLQMAKENNQISKATLKKFSMGDIAPRLLEARLFDLGPRDMAFDMEFKWESNAFAEIELRVGAKIPVKIKNLRFEGPVRLILVGLRPEEPGWEAMLISLPRPPRIGFDLTVAGGLITQIPWLRNELDKMLNGAIAEEVLWPRRSVVSAPSPYRAKPLLSPLQILSLMRDDPLLRMERELMTSIPDDFRSTYEAQQGLDGVPDVDIRQIDDGTRNRDGNDRDEEGGNDDGPSGGGWGFFRRRRRKGRPTEAEDKLKLIAHAMQQEASSARARTNSMPVMVLDGAGAGERKSILGRIAGNILLPRSMLSYARQEGGI